MNDTSVKLQPNRIRELDALRGLAAVAVVMFHYTTRYEALYGHARPLCFSFPYGDRGVELFFILSGFVIFMTLRRTRRVSDFVVGRFSRLYPVYWASVAFTFAVISLASLPGKEVGLTGALINATMIQHMLQVAHVDGVYWSLQVELMFYIGILCLYQLGAFRKVLTATMAWVLTCLAVHLAITQCTDSLPAAAGLLVQAKTVCSLRYFPLFAIGIVLYDLKQTDKSSLGHAFCIAVSIGVYGITESWFATSVAACFAVLMYLTVTGRLTGLAIRPLMFLGMVSYPLYLIHQNVGYVMIRFLEGSGIDPHAAILMAGATSIAVAYLLTLGVERPAMSAIRKLWSSDARVRFSRGLSASG